MSNTNSSASIGYGPSMNRLYFDGDDQNFEIWEMKFRAFLLLQGLQSVLDSDGLGTDFSEKNSRVFAFMVQMLDDKSLSLIMRDAHGKGKESLTILREHYIGSSKPRIISLYTELCSLKMNGDETVTDYVLRAESAATSLKNAKETVSDSLLIAMLLKGLPDCYKAFTTVVTQNKTDANFSEFKQALRGYEESEKCRIGSSGESSNSVMKLSSKFNPKKITCFSCGQIGHKSSDCPNRAAEKSKGRWCHKCKSNSHDTKFCRKNISAKSMKHSSRVESPPPDNSYLFKVGVANDVPLDACNKLLVDCGATAHIITDQSKFINCEPNFESHSYFIELADGSRHNNIVKAKGDALVEISDASGTMHKVMLSNALCIPSYSQDIFSVHAATSNGNTVHFYPDTAELTASDGNKFEITKQGRLYYLNKVSSFQTKTLNEWHAILGHCNKRDILKLESNVKGMQISDKSDFDCVTCPAGKMTEHLNREPDARASRPLELIHSDLCGPIDPISINHSKYAIIFVDDFSNLLTVYFLKNKSDAKAATERFLADMAPYGTIKRFRCDGGGEYSSNAFKNLLIENKIKQEFSCPQSPSQNGTSERSWRTLFDMSRCLLLESKLPKNVWNYALRYAAFIRNRCINGRTGKTPYENFTGSKPDLKDMHAFGSLCYAFEHGYKFKLDPRCKLGLFIGYDVSSPAHLVYYPETSVIKRIRRVNFPNKVVRPNIEATSVDEPFLLDISKSTDTDMQTSPDETLPSKPVETGVNQEKSVETSEEFQDCRDDMPNVSTGSRYPIREKRRPAYLEDYTNQTVDYCYRVNDIPKSYKEALQSEEASQWVTAMTDEMQSLNENETFEFTKLPKDRKLIGGRWVYAVKIGPNYEEKYKARFVAKGYSQIADIDYQETFAPTARISSIRMLLQISVQNNYILSQMDFKTAYLNADIDREIFVQQPEGFDTGDGRVLKLKKSLYGLKQSGRNWNNLLQSFLVNQGFTQSLNDYCVFIKNYQGSYLLIIVWVDDLLIAASDIQILSEMKKSLAEKFRMKDLGKLTYFLGIDFTYENGAICMSQATYLNRVLQRFKTDSCHPKSVPCDSSLIKDMNSDSPLLENGTIFREIVGSLIYAMTCTRPDLSYVVGKLSQNLAKPTNADLQLSKFVLKYIKGTLNYSLKFRKSTEDLKLIGFCDSDYANGNDRKSISGYCFRLSSNGPMIIWRSKKQTTVALSTCEAEYVALTAAVQEANFLQQLFSDMTFSQKLPVEIYCDNNAAISLAKNPVNHQRSKHIDVKYHYIRGQIAEGNVAVHYINTEDNVADSFTKPMNVARLRKFIPYLLG